LLNFAFGFSDLFNWTWAAAVIAIGIIVSQGLLGIPIIAIYSNEIASNSMLALLTLSQTVIFFGFGILFPFIVDASPKVGYPFFGFGVFMLFYMLFVWKYIRETGTLSDKEKKQLYSPKADKSLTDLIN
jgi:hypothetical protein